MTTQEIYKLASELTEEQVIKISSTFCKESKRSFESLVRLGDSIEVACATTVANNINKVDNYKCCYNAYCI